MKSGTMLDMQISATEIEHNFSVNPKKRDADSRELSLQKLETEIKRETKKKFIEKNIVNCFNGEKRKKETIWFNFGF